MPLGSIQKAYAVFQQHDFSRSFNVRILNMNGVPDYVYNQIIEQPAGQGGYLYAKTYSIPGRTIKDIALPIEGFDFHIPGQVAYDQPNPWTITFRTPGDYLVRDALERWSFDTISDESGCGLFTIPCPDTTIDIAVLSPKCEIMRVYRLFGVYPQSVGPIQYDLAGNEITEFEAGFHYQYWRPAAPYEMGDTNNVSPEVDAIYQAYEAKILAGVGSNCVGGTTLPALV